MISRRKLLVGSTALTACTALGGSPARAATGQFWGAIRWDSWWANTSAAQQAQGSIWPPQWQFRAPSWATVRSTGRLSFAPGQAQMNAEIAAATGKLAYWAYNYYPPGDANETFMNALAFHRTSSIKTQIKYCLILSLGHWGGTTNYAAINALVTTYAQDNYYMTVGGAPVVYLLWDPTSFAAFYGSSNAAVATSVANLRSQMVAAGLPTPYFVLMDLFDGATQVAIGADALGSYVLFPNPPVVNQTYASFASQVQAEWHTQTLVAAQVVPTVVTGWNLQTETERPVSFAPLIPWIGRDVHVIPGTDAEVAAHAAAGVAFINANPSFCPQKLGLIYAWNECSEGGRPLDPSIGDPTGTLLTAVGAAVV